MLQHELVNEVVFQMQFLPILKFKLSICTFGYDVHDYLPGFIVLYGNVNVVKRSLNRQWFDPEGALLVFILNVVVRLPLRGYFLVFVKPKRIKVIIPAFFVVWT